MPCGIGPIVGIGDVAVFDGVVVDVIDMVFHVVLVAYEVFPISWLPDTALAFAAI